MASLSFPTRDASQHSPPPIITEQNTQQPQPRVRRRNRLITSCLECRRRKLKCDKRQPCANCTKISRQCVFIAPGLDADGQARLAEVKEKMGILERRLEEDIARGAPSSSGVSSTLIKLPGQEASYSDQEDDEYTKDLDPSHLVTEDAAYYEEEGNDDIVDLGIAMGKVRITDRIGGLVRPRFSEEVSSSQYPGEWPLINCFSSLKRSMSFRKVNPPTSIPSPNRTPRVGWPPVATMSLRLRVSSSLRASKGRRF